MKGKSLQPRVLYSASLSFRFDGEIKSFPNKAKVQRIQHQQTSFTANPKGTSPGWNTREDLQNINPKQWRKWSTGSQILIITLNVNGLNAPTKRQRLAGWMKARTYMRFHSSHHSRDPPNCVQLFYIVRLITCPLWLTTVIIFYFLFGCCENW